MLNLRYNIKQPKIVLIHQTNHLNEPTQGIFLHKTAQLVILGGWNDT